MGYGSLKGHARESARASQSGTAAGTTGKTALLALGGSLVLIGAGLLSIYEPARTTQRTLAWAATGLGKVQEKCGTDESAWSSGRRLSFHSV